MKIHFLSADKPLTKKYTKLSDGTIEKTSFLNAYEVTSHDETVDSVDQFFTVLKKHAEAGNCLLKGSLTKTLVAESRAGSTDSAASTGWICLDIDGLPAGTSVEQLLGLLKLADVSYVLQWSSSMSMKDDTLRCHIFMLLTKPASAPLLKQWLIQLNHETTVLRDNMRLTKTNLSLTWVLDITACQNDKLIYIAPPILENMRNPLGRRPRYELVKKQHGTLTLPLAILTPDANRITTQARILALRDQAALPKRKLTTKTYKGASDVLANPDEATITEMKTDRGFVYFNLNGGDSWAYWHPEDNVEIIYNFKGEPNYKTSELLPSYYVEATANLTSQSKATQTLGAHVKEGDEPWHLAFRDRKTGIYFHGTYDPVEETTDLDVAKSEKQIRDYCGQYDIPIGEGVPIWRQEFDPHNDERINVEHQWLNTFSRTEYMRAPSPKKPVDTCPALIMKIIRHMLGDEQEIIEHFINWVAFIVQKRDRTNTAWVLYGTEGTGKGTFIKYIMRPLLGPTHVPMRRAEELMEKYNDYYERALIVFFDEAQITKLRDPETIMAKLRNFITENTISVRKMHATSVEVRNYSNTILGSNKPDVVPINPNDRRWNVGRFQPTPLVLSDAEFEALETGKHLQAFYNFLAAYPLDEKAARTPLETADRQLLISTTTSSADDVAAALKGKTANLEFFLEQLPTDNNYMSNAQKMNQVEEYRAIILALMNRTDQTDGSCKIARDELHTLFEYCVGGMSDSPNKFTKFLAHRHIHTEKVRIDKPVYGIKVTWNDATQFPEYHRDHFPVVNPKTLEKAKATK